MAFRSTPPLLALIVLAALGLIASPASAQHAHGGMHHGDAASTPAAPYAGQQRRAVKALSDQERSGLLAGEGLGMAKAAELNHYPGPRHVLDLAPQLHLTPAQRTATETLFAAMRERAVAVGTSIVALERELDARFAAGRMDAATLERLTGEIGRLRGTLRHVHLVTHLEMKRILTAEQVAAYDRLRGYGSTERSPHSEAP